MLTVELRRAQVETEEIRLPPETIQMLNDRLVLVYTGRARLARNLLQGVLRRWFGRLPEVLEGPCCELLK